MDQNHNCDCNSVLQCYELDTWQIENLHSVKTKLICKPCQHDV